MAVKKKRKKRSEDHVDESWLLPYSDLMTLLVALFVVLYAISSTDTAKFKQLAEAFRSELSGGTGVFENPSPIKKDDITETDEKKHKKLKTSQTKKQEEKKDIQKIQKNINTYIKQNKLKDQLETKVTDEGLAIRIRNDVLFDSGSADVKNEEKQIAYDISNLLIMKPKRKIIVSGHTDNMPIKNSLYESNWKLSASRAINFLEILLKNKELDPSDFSTKGYGEFKPIASNDTIEGRQKNRRVELLIIPNYPE